MPSSNVYDETADVGSLNYDNIKLFKFKSQIIYYSFLLETVWFSLLQLINAFTIKHTNKAALFIHESIWLQL